MGDHLAGDFLIGVKGFPILVLVPEGSEVPIQ
jgi:hypothetical protein